MFAFLISRFRHFLALPMVRRVQVVLVLLAGLLVVVLVAARKPWAVGISPDRAMKVGEYVTIFVWIALAADVFLFGFLAATASWWVGEPVAGTDGETRAAAPRWFWPLIVVAMIVNAFLCWPRLGHSFWHDETLPMRNAILGIYKKRDDGTVRLREVSWLATFYSYRKPNHALYSGLARAANSVWRTVARPRGLQFHEGVIRFPAFLAGIGSIASIALLLRHFGFFSAGVMAAFLTALHPWHIRYASEARAYAFVLLLVPLVIYALLRAVEGGRWRWWIAFGLAEFFLLYFYLFCLHLLVVVNVCAVVALALHHGIGRRLFSQVARWFAVNVFAAALFLPLILPCVPQFLEYVKTTPGQGQLSLDWIGNYLSHLLAGIPWACYGYTEPTAIELQRVFVAQPLGSVLIAFLAVGLLAVGVRKFFTRSGPSMVVPVIFLIPPIFCYAETAARGGFIYDWYLLFFLPGAIALVAVGMQDVIDLARTALGNKIAVATCVLWISGYTAWTTPQREFLRSHSIQPNRESVLATRPTLDPHDPRQKNILTATFYGAPEPYDPNIIMFRNARELGDLVRRADAEGKPLFLNLGYLTTVEGEHPAKYELLKTSGLFEEVGLFSGFEPSMHSRHVFRYIPGSAAGFDFHSVPSDRGRPGTGYSY
jgi:hypothetical protein